MMLWNRYIFAARRIMKKIVLASVIGLSLIFTGCAKISSMRAGVQIKSAQKYLLSEDYEKAIVRLNKAIAMDPKNVEAHLLLVEAYQKSDMNEEAEEVLEKLRDFDKLTEDQEEKLEALDSRKVYKDILMNFYNTGFIGNYCKVDVDMKGYTSIKDYKEDSYWFDLADVTGDGKDEIVILTGNDEHGSHTNIYEVVKDKALGIYIDGLGGLDMTDNNIIVENYYSTIYLSYLKYNSDLKRFEITEDSEIINKAVDMSGEDKFRKFDFVEVTPDNIVEAVDNMKISDSDLQESTKKPNKKENKRTIANYKELYRDILNEYYNNTLYEYSFRLEDITGDGQDELIIKEYSLANGSFYYIYEVKGDKVNKIFDGSCSELSFFEDGNILDSYGTNYDKELPIYDYYVYDKDISRFRLEKDGGHLKGDKEYFDKLANKPVKLYGWDVDTEITLSSIDEALR